MESRAERCDQGLKIFYTNADQFINKRDYLCMALTDDEPDVLLLTEVIPKAQVDPISPALLSIPGYSLYLNFDPSAPRLGASGIRGVAIYVKNMLRAMEVSFQGTIFQEQLWVELSLHGTDKLLIGCIYRSPSGDGLRNMESFRHLLTQVTAKCYSHCLICGDFNTPQIDWSSAFCTASDSHYAHKLLEIIQDNFLFQHVVQPTRYRQGATPSILDLILTNEEGMVRNLVHLSGLGKSDHVILRFSLTCYSTPSVSRANKLNYKRGRYEKKCVRSYTPLIGGPWSNSQAEAPLRFFVL